MSRPKQLVHRNKRIQFKVTPLEQEVAKLNAKRLNIPLSDLARNGVLNVRVYKPFSDEEFAVLQSLVRYKTDFDRIARYFKNSDPKFAGEVLSIAHELKEQLEKLRK